MVSNQQFRLKWNNHRNTVLQEFETLLHNNSFVDCTIGADGKYLKAHKIVLSACSPYLQNVFSEHFDKHPVILLKDVSFKELKCMIDYMYCGEVNISECELPSFLRTAQSLKIKGLAEDLNDYDSSSDNEHPDTSAFPSDSSRTVEANVEIHDDEPPAKKSAPSLISANVVNNSLAGRKRKTPNPVPITGKINASSQSQIKSGVAATTPNSNKPADVLVPTSAAESESTERTTSTATTENCVDKSESKDTSNKPASQSESQEQKSRTEVKEEPVDTDADNEDNSSYECANNPCDDSDPLNEDSESNCANSGNKFGEVSIASVSSYNEGDANDNSRTSIIKEEISALEMMPGKIEPIEIEVDEQLDENEIGAFMHSEETLQCISETVEDVNDSIIVEMKSLSDEFDCSLFDENVEGIGNAEVVTCQIEQPAAPSTAPLRKLLPRTCGERVGSLLEFDEDELSPRKSARKKQIHRTTKPDKSEQPPLRKLLPASLKPATVQPRPLLPMPAASSDVTSPTVKYPVSAKTYPSSRDDVMTSSTNPATSYRVINLPGAQSYSEISGTSVPQIMRSTKNDNFGQTIDVRGQHAEIAGANSQIFVLNTGNPLMLLNSNASSLPSTSAPVYKLSTPPRSSVGVSLAERPQQVSLVPRSSLMTAGADPAAETLAVRRLMKDTFAASKRSRPLKPVVTVTKTANAAIPMRQFRKIAPLVKPKSEDYRCAKCFELFHNKDDAKSHACSAATNKKRNIARVVQQYQ